MATIKSQMEPAEVHRAREQFERWRAGKQGRERIPTELWGMAAELCGTYSIHQVARWLRLNYTALKAEVVRRSGLRRHKVAAATKPACPAGRSAFVEWSLPGGMVPGSSSAEYVVEVPDPKKGTPRILVRGASGLEVAALVRALRAGSGS